MNGQKGICAMKKMIMTFVFSLIAIVAFAFVNDADALAASAVNDLSASVTKLTAAEEDAQVGDYKVTLSIAQNSGIAGFGIRFFYDSANFTPVMNEDNSVSFRSMASGFMFSVEHNNNEGLIGVAAISGNNYRRNGELVSFYFTKTGGAENAIPLTSVEVDQISNLNGEDLSYSFSNQCAVSSVYRVGDANADGSVRVYDASLIRQIISNANGVTVTENNFMNYMPTTNVGEGVCFALMDADGNGVLTDNDATLVTRYLAGYPANAPLLDFVTVYITISIN